MALTVAFVAVAFLGAVWYFDMDPADVGSTALDTIGELAEQGSVALEGIGEMADDGSIILDNFGDTARDVADIVESQKHPGESAGRHGVVAEPPVDSADVAEAPQSPLDRTIYPDGTTHGSRSGMPESTAPTTPVPEPAPQQTKAELTEEIIHTITNQHREAAGLQPLERILKIDQIARSHSEDMSERNYFEHDTPEGLDPTDRGNTAGYPCRKDYGSYYTFGLAENIFWHSGTWYSADILANEIMDGWMDSRGHRMNIMEPSYDRIGVGVAIGSGAVYATQNFC